MNMLCIIFYMSPRAKDNAVIVQVYVLFCFDPQEAKYDESNKRDALIDPRPLW
jgi:hypothetical protein